MPDAEKKPGFFKRGFNFSKYIVKERITNKFTKPSSGGSKVVVVQAGSDKSSGKPKNSFLTAVIILAIYLSLSIWPFPVLPLFNIWTIALAVAAIWAWGSGNHWIMYFLVIFALITPFFGLNTVTQDLFSLGTLKAQDLREKIGLSNPLDTAKSWVYKNYGSFGNPDVVEKEPQKGVQILTFASTDVFQDGKPVRIDAKVQVDGLYNSETQSYEDQAISFACHEEDSKGNRLQDGTIVLKDNPNLGNIFYVRAQDAQQLATVYLSCQFPQGMHVQTTGTPVSGSLAGIEEGTVMGNKIVTKKRVVLEATSKMLQIAALKLWTVQDANAPEDITKVVNDPTLDSDGRSKVQCRKGCGGPYFLTLSTGVMPITEEKSPVVRVSFTKNENRFGTIAHLNSLRLTFPQPLGVSLDLQGEQTTCDFDGQMTLSEQKLKEVNQQLAGLVNITDTAQLPTLPLDFQCGYKVGQPLQTLGFQEVTTRADYNVVIRKLGLVDVYKDKPTTQGVNTLA